MQGPIDSIETRQLISELQQQVSYLTGGLSNLQTQVATLPINNPPSSTPQAVNQIRNGSYSHSVNSWADVVNADNGRYECAWWFSHPIVSGQAMFSENSLSGGSGQITLTLGVVSGDQITITSHGLQTGTAFRLSGSIPSPLAAATTYFAIRIDANTIEVASSYANAIAGTQITLTNTTTGGDLLFNYTLKDDSHTVYSEGFSDWDIPTGSARLTDSNFDLSTFLPGRNAEAGQTMYAVFSIARQNQYVTALPSVRIFAGLYGESTALAGWDWLYAPYEITATVSGTVATPTTREYRVKAITSRGVTFRTSVLSVANAPSDTDFGNGARVVLQFPQPLRFGISSYEIYRNTGGTYVLLATLTQNTYIDNNSFQSAAAGWPTADFDKLVAYTATAENVVAAIGYVGDPNFSGWVTLPLAIPIPQDYDKSDTVLDSGQWLRWGLTGDLDLEIENDITTVFNSNTFTSTVGQFTSSMVGKTVTITVKGGGGSNELTTTITAVNTADEIQTADNWVGENNSFGDIYIEGGAPPHSLSIDLSHLTFIQGAGFSPNAEDISPDRGNPAATPNGTTQGPIIVGQTPGNPDGFPTCLHQDEIVLTTQGEVMAKDLEVGMMLVDPLRKENRVEEVRYAVSDVYLIETDNGVKLWATKTKKIYISPTETRILSQLRKGDTILTMLNGELVPAVITLKELILEKQVVVQVKLLPEHSFLAGHDGYVVVDNQKPEIPVIV